jgi:hypothetical protein
MLSAALCAALGALCYAVRYSFVRSAWQTRLAWHQERGLDTCSHLSSPLQAPQLLLLLRPLRRRGRR